MAISSSHFHVALYEAKHAAFGTSVGFSVTAIHVTASQGHVIWSNDFPVLEELAWLWPRNPEATTALVRHAVATLLSPHDGDRFPTLCHDSILVAQFGRAWYGLPAVSGAVPTPWLVLLRQAHAAVRSWYQQPGAACTLVRLAHHLARVGTLDALAWTTLWESEYGQRLRQPTPAGLSTLPPLCIDAQSCSIS